MFWNVFYKLCEENNTKPNAVAKTIGVSSATCTKWKNGAVPNGETLLKLADCLNVSVDYLLGRNEESKSVNNSYNQNGNNNFQAVDSTTEFSKRDAELIQKINSLDFNDYVYIINYINDRIGNAK